MERDGRKEGREEGRKAGGRVGGRKEGGGEILLVALLGMQFSSILKIVTYFDDVPKSRPTKGRFKPCKKSM